DWWTTGSMRLRLYGDVMEREVLAAEADVIAAPQRSTDLERLEKAPDATLERHADGLELLPDGWRVCRNADAEDHAALGDAVQRADDVGEHHRIAQRRQKHRGAEPDAARSRSDGGQERQRLVAWPRGDRIADPHRVEAGPLGTLGHGQHGRRL